MFRFLKNNAGYGLITTIISICVLSTITITSMTLLTNMMSSLEFFRSNVVAQTLAMSKANVLWVADYASVVNEARAQVDTTYKLDRELLVNEIDLGGGKKQKNIIINIYKTGAADTLFTMNYTLASAGSGTAAVPHGQQTFTANGTFTVPQGVTQLYVSGTGGGGGGGGGGNNDGGSGGGGAACAIKTPVTVTPGEAIPVTIGAKGAGAYFTADSLSIAPTAGGITSFGSYLSLPGGLPGDFVSNGSRTLGGAPGGFGGMYGNAANSLNLGQGGNSLFGAGGTGIYYYGITQCTGISGSGYGSGGGAGYSSSSSIFEYGGDGAPGFLFVEW